MLYSFPVTIRVGGGTRGNIANSVISTNVNITGNTATLENTSQGTGGSDAETVEHAKKYAPLTFRRQDRLVTLDDYKSFGNSFISSYGSVGKVTAATRRAYSSGNIVNVIILEKANDLQLRKATPSFKLDLLSHMNRKKMLTTELVAMDGLIRTVDLTITAQVDRRFAAQEESIKLKVRDKVLEFFSVDNNDFGKDFVLADLVRAVYQLDEVQFATVDNLDDNVHLEHNEIIQLNNLTINISLV